MKSTYFSMLIFLFSLTNNAITQNSYFNQIESWRQERINSLTAPKSWSSLFGLFWLENKETSIGANESFDIYLPNLNEEDQGTIQIFKDTILFKQFDSDTYTEIIKVIKPDQDVIEAGQYFWSIIDRNGKLGLRIWDSEHPNRKAIDMLPYFPIAEKYRVKARFIKNDPPVEKVLSNVLGMKVSQKIYGKIAFDLDGDEFYLDAYDGGTDHYFVIFGDRTNGAETYGGGRYLYCKKENKDGIIIIDFNKAFTPPCGFTDYATCLLPTPENTLNLELRAGEKYTGNH